MPLQFKFFSPFLFLLLLTCSTEGFAWTLRGHQAVCEAAIFLIQDSDLREFLQGKGLEMAHLCNIPDTQWRDSKSKDLELGNASHYFASDLVPSEIKTADLDYSLLIQKFLASQSKLKEGPGLYKTLGSNWWRANQFYMRAIATKPVFVKVSPPENSKDLQNYQHPFNQAVFDFVVNLGLMGHFVGDNSQPFHVTLDYDGYEKGHGGIHLFYEDEAVNALPENFFQEVLKEGHALLSNPEKSKWIKDGSILKRMRKIGEISLSEKEEVLKWDTLLQPSSNSTRTPAKREEAKVTAEKAKSLIVRQIARAAALLAQFWEEAYHDVGSPPLKKYKSYQFPTQVEFVAPNYLH